MTFSVLRGARRAIAALALAATGACATAPLPPVETVAAAPSGPALWKVADADTTIYLFGTVHALPAGINWQRGAIGAALAASDTLVTEVALPTADDTHAMQQAVIKNGMLPAGQTLRALLTEAQRKRYEAAVTRLGMPVQAFDRFEPWYASLLFTTIPLAKTGVKGENGVEQALGAAAGSGKRRDALETVEYQMSLFDSLPMDAQIAYLMDVVDGNEDVRPQLDRMVAEWLHGDADALARLMNEDMAGQPALMERLLYQRNRTWAGWIADRLDSTPGTVFLAVGAGHLAGRDSVRDALAARGLTVSRVQ